MAIATDFSPHFRAEYKWVFALGSKHYSKNTSPLLLSLMHHDKEVMKSVFIEDFPRGPATLCRARSHYPFLICYLFFARRFRFCVGRDQANVKQLNFVMLQRYGYSLCEVQTYIAASLLAYTVFDSKGKGR